MREFFVRRYFPIERSRSRDLFALARQQHRVAAAHAESRNADASRTRLLLRAQPFHRGLKIRDTVFLLQSAHQLRRRVGISRDLVALSRVEARSDREVTFTREPTRHVSDLFVQPPPLTHHA